MYHSEDINRRSRISHTLNKTSHYIGFSGGIVLVVVSFIPKKIYSYVTSGRPPRKRKFRKNSANHQRGSRCPSTEWTVLSISPEPEVIKLWAEEHEVYRDERRQKAVKDTENRIMRALEESGLGLNNQEDVKFEQAWEPKGVFRFLDLPEEIQLIILKELVVRRPGRKWTAHASYCKDGFIFEHLPPNLQHRYPCQERHATMKNVFALWRTEHTSTTTSLLLTSKRMHHLTNSALGLCFSGHLKFRGRRHASQLDASWPWYFLTTTSLFVPRKKWLFDRVRTVETPHFSETWPNLLTIMPNLERIKLTPNHGCWAFALDFRESGPTLADKLEDFWSGKYDSEISLGGIEAGKKWIAWCQQREQAGERTVEVSIRVTIRFSSYQTKDVSRRPLYG